MAEFAANEKGRNRPLFPTYIPDLFGVRILPVPLIPRRQVAEHADHVLNRGQPYLRKGNVRLRNHSPQQATSHRA